MTSAGLLDVQPCPRALVSTHVENQGARCFYERHGWQYFQPDCIVQAGPRPLVVMYWRQGTHTL